MAWRWVVPNGWEALPVTGSVRVVEGGKTEAPFAITIPASFRFAHPKQAIALDVSLKGKGFGQITEAVVENRPFGAASARRER